VYKKCKYSVVKGQRGKGKIIEYKWLVRKSRLMGAEREALFSIFERLIAVRESTNEPFASFAQLEPLIKKQQPHLCRAESKNNMPLCVLCARNAYRRRQTHPFHPRSFQDRRLENAQMRFCSEKRKSFVPAFAKRVCACNFLS
jgi:hypothetical protein